MAADGRLFAEQKKAIPHLSVPDWIDPIPGESLTEYAARFAQHIDPGEPCIIGGASLGGFIAVELARHLDAEACVLIGSAPHPRHLRAIVRWLRHTPWVVDLFPVWLFQWDCRWTRRAHGRWMPACYRSLMEQGADTDPAFFRWAAKATSAWQAPEPLSDDTPVYQIHGKRDWIIPLGDLEPDTVVPRGGHALTLFHPEAVTDFLLDVLDKVTTGRDDS